MTTTPWPTRNSPSQPMLVNASPHVGERLLGSYVAVAAARLLLSSPSPAVAVVRIAKTLAFQVATRCNKIFVRGETTKDDLHGRIFAQSVGS